MSGGGELVDALTWLLSRLVAGPVADRVYADVAPTGATWPVIVFNIQSPGRDNTTLEGIRQLVTPLVLVRAVTQGASYVPLKAIDQYIDLRLTLQTGVGIASCVRESPFLKAETIDGVSYRQLGGLYRLFLY